jgi:hypothetical protein
MSLCWAPLRRISYSYHLILGKFNQIGTIQLKGIHFNRFQLSCDLNPAPVSSGNGFDYDLIARWKSYKTFLAMSLW